MVFKKNNKWIVDITVGGRNGKRYRKRFKTQAEAKKYHAHAISKHQENPDWSLVTQKDNRRLGELIDQWYEYHGKSLKDGLPRLNILKSISSYLKNPRICNFTKHDWTYTKLAITITNTYYQTTD